MFIVYFIIFWIKFKCPFLEEGNLKSLGAFLGTPVLELAVLFVLEGRQVIIRGDIPDLVSATVKTLKVKVDKKNYFKMFKNFIFDANVKYQKF